MVKDIDKRKLKKIVKNEQTVRRRVGKLKENTKRVKFHEKVKKLIVIDMPNIYEKTFKNGVSKASEKHAERRQKESW